MTLPLDVLARQLLWPSGRDWLERAKCAGHDPQRFFATKGRAEGGLAICATCPVQAECLEFALANDQRYGIWGGTTECRRRRMLDRRTQSPDTNRRGEPGD